MQARLICFLRDSPWDDRSVRREAARHAVNALQEQEPVSTWIIDDTGFPKQGKHSVGVQRQYSGTLGKIGNCQIGVSLTIATRQEHVPIDFALYMPKSWTEDSARREKSKVPADLVFKTKPELALELIARAVEDQIPGEIVLVDSAYGSSSEFRNAVRAHGLDLGVAVQANTKVWPLDKLGRRRGEPVSVQDLGVKLGRRAFRRLTWRVGTGGKLWSRFTFRRVKVAHDDGTEAQDREPLWLVIEWPDGESKPTKFALTTLPRRLSKEEIVRIIKERWRTEQAYEELKGALGLDHFEGRSFPGWHHHVSVVLCCYAFIVSERVRRFPPSHGRKAANRWSRSRPERHFADSFITMRLVIAGPSLGGCRGVPPVTGLVTLLMNTQLVTIDLPLPGQPLAVASDQRDRGFCAGTRSLADRASPTTGKTTGLCA